MSEYKAKAKKRLDKEANAKEIKGRHELAVKSAVHDALISFIEQSDEFAQAVVQASGSFGDCLIAVVKGVSSSLSDIEAYRRAVAFYFPGAEVEMALTIHMSKYEREEKSEAESVTLSLFDLM